MFVYMYVGTSVTNLLCGHVQYITLQVVCVLPVSGSAQALPVHGVKWGSVRMMYRAEAVPRVISLWCERGKIHW